MLEIQRIISMLESTSTGLITPSNVNSDVRITCVDGGGGCPNNAGGPDDIVTIAVAYPYNFITPLIAPFFKNKPLMINVSATFTNEPFPPGAS